MTGSQTRLMRQLVPLALVLLGVSPFAQCNPSPPSVHSSSSRGPPALPQYYATSSHRPPSVPPPYPTSSLSPTSPVYTAQRIRSSDYNDNRYNDNDGYPSAGTSNLDQGKSQDYEDAPENSGFVEPIDFSGLLKDIGSSPKGPNLDIQSSQSNPLFASESKDAFQGFGFGSTKNPFEELSRLHTASSDHNGRQQGDGDEVNVGFVDPNVQFRSLFDSAGTSATTGFGPGDFLGSKSENVGSAPSKGSQTRAYPSFTYSGRGNDRDREEEDNPRDYDRPNRYRSNYRQVNNGGDSRNNDYPSNNPQHNNPEQYQTNRGGQYNDYDGISNNSPQTDSYDDYDGRGQGPSYVANSGPGRRGVSNERSTPRYSSHAAQETAQSPQSKPRAAESSKNPKCKKVEKSVDYGDDHASFTAPDDDYDPSTYQGRYKRQARQRQRSGGAAKRPMTCYVCEDEHGRYAEKCSYDSKGSPSNKDGNNYFHSESSSFSDNGRRPSRGGGRSKDRHRRNSNRQRYSTGSDDPSAEESTTKKVYISVEKAEIAESEPAKVIGKRQSGDFYGPGGGGGRGGGGGGGRGRNNQNRDEYGDPYDGSTGSYAHPSGYEGPPLGDNSGNRDEYGGGHGGGRGGGRGGSRGHHHGSDSDYNFGPIPDYEREAASATREYDFSIPREFDPDYQLRPTNGKNNNQRQRQSNPHRRGPPGDGPGDDFEYNQSPFQANSPDSSPHQSASNRQDNRDEFDTGYNDYIRQNFPEAFNSQTFTEPSFSPGYDFKPNYYHQGPRQQNNQDGGGGGGHSTRSNSPEVSHSPSHDSHRGYENGHGRGHGHHDRGNSYGRGNSHDDRDSHSRGHYSPVKEHTQPSHNFSPPPGFFSEDAPAEGLGNILKEFSTRSRDGCRQVKKGDMTCYVCRDAKGGNKEECMYASNDPKNKAMAYHEVTEYSSPQGRFLPAPLHASLLGQPEQIADNDDHFSSSSDEGRGVPSSPLAFTPTDAVTAKLDSSSSQINSKTVTPTPFKIKKEKVEKISTTRSALSSPSTEISSKIEKENVQSSSQSSTTNSPKRSKRSPPQGTKKPAKEYDFDYDY